MDDVHVYVVKLPGRVHEMAVPNVEDDGYTIYINESLTREQAHEAFLHALKHIRNNDFEKADTDAIERDAHKSE